MRRVGGFRSVLDLETFGQQLKQEGFHVDSKPFGKLKYLEVGSENLQAQLYLLQIFSPLLLNKKLTPKSLGWKFCKAQNFNMPCI